MAGTDDPPQPLHVDVQELARALALVADDRLKARARLEPRAAVAVQDRVHGRGGQPERPAERMRAEPQGVVRVSCPASLIYFRIADMIARFMAKHPKVTVHLESTNRRVDVIREGFDIAIRVRPTDAGSRVDVRSVSRVGVGDFGTNAARVRAYLAKLEDGISGAR